MKIPISCISVAALVALAGEVGSIHAAGAQPVPQSVLDATESVEIGGKVLPPGRYLLRVVPENENRNLLQVTGEDGEKVYVTVLSVPHARELSVGPESQYVFFPAIAGLPIVLRTWYEAGGAEGHDIVYPRDRAMELAALHRVPVESIASGTNEEELNKALRSTMTPKSEEAPPGPLASAQMASNEPPAEPEKEMPAELPAAGSHLPLVALLGAVSLGGGLLLRGLSGRAG